MDSLPNDPILQFNPDTLEQVRKHHNLDDPVRMEQALKILEDWIEKQNHFTVKKFDRKYLEMTLIISKGSVETVKSYLDTSCTLRSLLPKYFTDCNLKRDLKELQDVTWVVPLPKMTKEHYRVYVTKSISNDVAQNFVTLCKWNIMTCEYLKAHDYMEGVIVVHDYRKVNVFEFVTKIGIPTFQEFLSTMMKGVRLRVKAMHIINESKIMDIILPIIKKFISEKIITRVLFHHDVQSLSEYIEPSVLPVELGGTERSLDILRREWIEVLSSEEHMEYMKRMNQAKTDETNRLQDKFNTMYMGTPGSFRTLTVD